MSTRVTVSPHFSLRPPRKIRADAKLERLSAPQRVRLRVWLADENRTYTAVVALVRAEFGLSVGKSAVAIYYQRHILAKQRDEELEAATALARLPIANVSAAHLHHAKALAWLLLARPVPQIDAAIRLLNVIHRVEWQEIRRQRLALKAQRAALRETLAARRPISVIVAAAPAPAREISQTPPRFPGYSRLLQPSATALLTSPQPPLPLPPDLHSLDPRPHPLDPIPTRSPFAENYSKLPSISGLFPDGPALHAA